MKITKYALLSTAVISLSAVSTVAIADDEGFYAGANIGFNFQQDQNSTGNPNRDLDLDFDNGGFYAGQIGYKFKENHIGRIRTEFELSYRENDVDDIVFNNNSVVGGGDQDVLAGLANVYYDFTSVHNKLTPFVGAGIGFANIDSNVSYNNGNATLNDDDNVFAYQAIIGADYKINDQLSIVSDARYFALEDPELTRFGGPPPAQFTDLDSEYDSFVISTGLRYNF